MGKDKGVFMEMPKSSKTITVRGVKCKVWPPEHAEVVKKAYLERCSQTNSSAYV